MQVAKEEFTNIGVKFWDVNVDSESWKDDVNKIAEAEGYTSVAVAENPEQALSAEHSHNGDEVRLMLEGSAMFQIRINDEMKDLIVSKGNMISIPAGVWHRFGPENNDESYTSVRFFHDKASWNKTMRD